MKRVLPILFSLLAFSLYAQNPQLLQRAYGTLSTSEQFADIVLTPGGVAALGVRDAGQGRQDDFWLVKTDQSGAVSWEKRYGGPHNDIPSAMATASDGGFLLAGLTTDPATSYEDAFLVKTDTNGNQLWRKTFDSAYNNRFTDVLGLADGSILAVQHGYFGSQFQSFLRKLDANGNEISANVFVNATVDVYPSANGDYWVLIYSAGSSEVRRYTLSGALASTWPLATTTYPAFAEISPSEGILVADDYTVFKMRPNGITAWQQALDAPSWSIALAAATDGRFVLATPERFSLFGPSGNFLSSLPWPDDVQPARLAYDATTGRLAAAGYAHSNAVGRNGALGMVLLTNPVPQFAWFKQYGPTAPLDWESGESLFQSQTDRGFWLAGNRYETGGGRDFYVVRTDADGNPLWERRYGNAADERLASMTPTADGGCLLAGRQNAAQGVVRALVLRKINHLGDLLWEKTYPYPTLAIYAQALELPDGNFMVAYRASKPILMKTNATGDSLWTKSIGTTEIPSLMRLGSDGQVLVTGTGNQQSHGFLIKTDLNGKVLFNTPLYHRYDGDAYGLEQIGDKYFVTGAVFDNLLGGDSIQVTRLSLSGKVEWIKYYDFNSTDASQPTSAVTADGQLLVATLGVNIDPSFARWHHVKVLKLSPDGGVLSDQTIQPPLSTNYLGRVIAASGGGFAAVGTASHHNTSDMTLIWFNGEASSLASPLESIGGTLSPNPSNGPLRLRLEGDYQGTVCLRLFDVRGRAVQQQYYEKTQAPLDAFLDLGSLPQGTYMAHIQFADGRNAAHKILKY